MIFEVGSMKGLFFIGILKILEGDIAILGRGKIEMLGKIGVYRIVCRITAWDFLYIFYELFIFG